MSDASERPRLRPVEVHRLADGARRGIVLIDPLEVATGQCFIPQAVVPIVARFDGEHTVEEVESELRAAGRPSPPGFVANLVRQLDDALWLDSPRGRDAERAACGAFLAGGDGARPARHPGSAGYPAQATALRARLRDLVPPAERVAQPTPRGLIAPHIDLLRGDAGYRAAYGHLAACEPADLYVIFGTGHKGPKAPVTGLLLDWDTPLGRVTTDRAFIERVHREVGEIDPRDAFLHRDEHSLEFQVLMLSHVLQGRPFMVAGFLCGSLPSASGEPDQEAYVRTLLAAFHLAASASGKKVCYVAGADMAHLGPFFGDARAIDQPLLHRLEQDDRARLAQLSAGRPSAFHRQIEGDGNGDRVCGTTPMYLCAALAGGPAELLHYGQAVADDSSQVVSFASMVFR